MKYLLMSIMLSISLLFVAVPVHAQNNQTPNTYNNGSGSNGSTDGSTGTTNDNSGFDWRWLLPLLAIPILFIAFSGSNDDTTTYRETNRYTGVKGGRTSRTTTEVEEEDTV
jgi:hypothetical protein